MHDVVLVRVGERIGHARADGKHLLERQQIVGLDVGREVLALQELHRDVGEIVLFAGVVDRDDVGMSETPRGLGFAEKPLFDVLQLVGLELLRQRHRLDRHHAADLGILAEVDDAHRALAQLLLHLVAAEHWLFHAAAGQDHGAAMTARRRPG